MPIVPPLDSCRFCRLPQVGTEYVIVDNLRFRVLDEGMGLNHARQTETERFRIRRDLRVKLVPISSPKRPANSPNDKTYIS